MSAPAHTIDDETTNISGNSAGPLGASPFSTRAKKLMWHHPPQAREMASWARFFVTLGERLAFHPLMSGGRVTIGFALPALEKAAVLTATGLVCERAKVPVTVEDNGERFERLRTLPLGKAVRVLRKGRLYVGEVANEPEHTTTTTFPVLFSADERSRRKSLFLCSAKNCMQVEPTDDDSQAGIRQRGMRIIEYPSFTLTVLDGPSIESLCFGSRMDFAIVGVRGRILAEADSLVSISAGSSSQGGVLSDLLRLKEGARDFRGMIVPTTAKEPRLPNTPPHTVIYDGASSFIKFRDRFENSHEIVLLDRSEPRFLDAVNELNRLFLGRSGECPPQLLAGKPAGIEHIAFHS